MPIYAPMVIKGRGGALPEYQRQSGNYAPGAGVSARFDDSAARIATAGMSAGSDALPRALANLGKSIRDATVLGVKAYDDYSQAKAIEALTIYRREMNSALYGDDGILTRQGEEAFTADNQREERAQKLRRELLKDTNATTQYYFNLRADEFDSDTSLKAQRYAQDQRTNWFNRNDEAAAQERADFAMASFASPEDFTKGTGEALWFGEQLLRRKGYSGEALQHGLKEMRSKIFRGGIQQALARGDIAAATRLLSQGSGGRWTPESEGDNGGGTASAGGSLSARNLAAHNYGNTKNTQGGFNAYASRADGLMGVGERVLRYNNAPERGWHAQTLREMVDIYAPKGDGENDPEAYAAFLGKRLGVDPNAKIDFRDPNILAGLIQSMPVMEHGAARVNISDEEAMQAAQALLSGQKPRIVGQAGTAAGTSRQSGESAQPASGETFSHMTAADVGWASQAIRSTQEHLAAKAEANASKSMRELLKGRGEAERQAEYFGDTTQMEALASGLDNLGKTAEAALLRQKAEEYKSTGEARRFAAEKTLPEVTARMQEIQTALESAEKNKDTAEYAKQAKTLNALQTVYAARSRLLKADPAAAVEQSRSFQLPDNATPEDRVTARLSAQAKNGVAKPLPLTKGETEAVAGAYLKAEKRMEFLQSLKQAYGSQSEAVLKQLITSGQLPQETNLVLDMPPAAGDLLLQMHRKGAVKETETALGVDKSVRDSITTAVRDELSDLFTSFRNQGASAVPALVLDAAYKLSLKYMEQGMKADDAGKRAAQEVLGDRYTVRDGYRVPKTFDADEVRQGLKTWLTTLAASDDIPVKIPAGLTEAQARARAKSLLLHSARFVNTPDESGLLLVVDGQYVKDNTGQLVQVPLETLADLGSGSRPAKNNVFLTAGTSR